MRPDADGAGEGGVRRPGPGRWILVVGIALVVVIGVATGAFLIGRSGRTPQAAASPSDEPPPTTTPTPSPSPEPVSIFDAVWPEAVDDDVHASLLKRCKTFPRCRKAILDLGGSEAAADFYRETDLFLIDTYPAGPVAIGFVTGPLWANYVAGPVLVADPWRIILPDDEVAGMRPQDETFFELTSRHPDLQVWPSEPTVEPPVFLESGGGAITFQYELLDGCHACEWLGSARFTLSFDAGGELLGAKARATCGSYQAIVDFGAKYCPATIDESAPESSPAETPREATSMLVDAWRAGDVEQASAVAMRGPIDFMWSLPDNSPNIEAGGCIKSRPWNEHSCDLGYTEFVAFALVVEGPEGYFVATAGFGE
jgi:hypothetical protein